jgi:ATP-dependent DNA ligase
MRWHNPGPVRRPPGFIEPCLPTNGRTVPDGPQWAYEIKHDGFRFVCRRDGKQVRVFSRRGHDWTDRVPRIVEALKALRVKSVTIDGEGVVCRPDGVSDFDLLRAAVGRLGSRDAFLYVFDVLEINGTDLRPDAWEERRKVLVRAPTHCQRRRGPVVRAPGTAKARSPSIMPAAWDWKASSRSGEIDPIAQAARRTGIKIKNPAALAVTRLIED